MKVKLTRWFKPASRKVMLTGQDIIELRSDVSELQLILSRVVDISLVTLREDVNSALSGTAKAIYKLEELEIRVDRMGEAIKTYLK